MKSPFFDEELLRFLEEAARYYFHPLGEVLRSAAPALPTGALKKLRKGGFLEQGEKIPGRSVAHHKTWSVRRTEKSSEGTRLGNKQEEVLDGLSKDVSVSLDKLRDIAKNPRTIVRALVEKGLVSIEEIDVPTDPYFAEAVPRDTPPTLTSSQRLAVDEITQALDKTDGTSIVLHGVTGSGKTEVYLHAIEEALKLDKGVIVLVPEIALTPQLVHRFRARFGDSIAVLHSGLKEKERDEAWRSLRQGRVRIAIGARSALFAPIQNLGVIVVDEEHDPSFKQEEGFRYHARDMALLRAKRAGAVCVLGSATPSVESFFAATKGKHKLLSLPSRATGQKMPDVEIVDLRQQSKTSESDRLLSPKLLEYLRECLQDGGQAILFLNRRGFAPSLRCTECGELAHCPACSVALTEHRYAGMLRCHYCDFSTPMDAICKA